MLLAGLSVALHRSDIFIGAIPSATCRSTWAEKSRYVDPANIAKCSLDVQRGLTYVRGGVSHGTDRPALARVRTRSGPRRTALQSAVLRNDETRPGQPESVWSAW